MTIEDLPLPRLFGLLRSNAVAESQRHRAADAALRELIEVEVQYLLDQRHQNVGFHKVSPCAGLGEGRGELTGAVDHVGDAAERYRVETRWRSMARALLAHLSERQQAAVLLSSPAMVRRIQRDRVEWARMTEHAPIELRIRIAGGDLLTLEDVVEPTIQRAALRALGYAPMARWQSDFVHVDAGLRGAPLIDRSVQPEGRTAAKLQESWLRLMGLAPGALPFASVNALWSTAKRARAQLFSLVQRQAQLIA